MNNLPKMSIQEKNNKLMQRELSLMPQDWKVQCT